MDLFLIFVKPYLKVEWERDLAVGNISIGIMINGTRSKEYMVDLCLMHVGPRWTWGEASKKNLLIIGLLFA